ncbi:MAG: M67 family metallopeptidase [Rhodospirillaceae bacterium]|jgi:[CysO sulfur-carrier protein]-S-L-cysteine hydrolase|nr:M67 family metallopeptidase [Rhodospirillaceae bacterium]MBT5245729.1 M67 family metallopeptidase [Rhodospirillaceae bacterium]MBT5561481.1 M67 family metallopeptidase [Rhodospirillaceae bacterium]MBT6242919.1 M67 family metallopeptidase [Rhodospirillaceae bacterium]MBT7138239.1 M67 family metallopeptidase [Rhodospirillaceae bacterium]
MISIANALMAEITTAAEAAYPDECCGLLSGFGEADKTLTITGVHTSDNVTDGTARDRFEVDPKIRFDVMRELEGGPERIVGHYHSHPDHPAQPSEYDLKMAFEPDLLWFIVAVDEGRATETTAHRVDADATAFHEIPITTDLKDPS